VGDAGIQLVPLAAPAPGPDKDSDKRQRAAIAAFAQGGRLRHCGRVLRCGRKRRLAVDRGGDGGAPVRCKKPITLMPFEDMIGVGGSSGRHL
jgi:hypothetical protein